MVEIADVKDRESLGAYLEGLEGDAGFLTARRVGFRVAARVLPVALDHILTASATKHKPTSPVIFGALAFAALESVRAAPLETLADALVAADVASDAALDSANVAASQGNEHAADAAFAASCAANSAGPKEHAVRAADAAAKAAAADVWAAVRADLERSTEEPTGSLTELWPGVEEPDDLRTAWEQAKWKMEADTAADWSFWILWYERVRAGRDFHADKLAEILNPLREDDWKKGPADINPLFDDLLALYREEDAAWAVSDADISGNRSARQIRAVRAQVSTLKDYVESEYEFLRGQNQQEPGTEDEVDALVEILRQLRALVDEMLRTIDDEGDAATALVAVDNALPAVVEKADALAQIEHEPYVSEVVLGMASSIKVLTDSGTPGTLATGIAVLDMLRKTAMGWLKRDRSQN